MKERKEKKMKKITRKMAKAIAKSWKEVNEMMVKTSVYSL